MSNYVKLDEAEVFQALEEFTDAAVEKVAEQAMSKLSSRHYESETALKIRLMLAERKIAKYAHEITRLMDLHRDAAIEFAKWRTTREAPIQLPHVTKRQIDDLSRQIEAIHEEAKLFALRFGWKLIGRVDPETAEWEFQKLPIRETFCGRRVS
jgi:polyhydroxyalkanoate synthesis regulator protein